MREGGEEVHVTGQYGQIPVQLIIWNTFANLRITLRTNAGLKGVAEGISLQHDEDAEDYAGEQLDRDDWDDDDEQKFYLSPHVYLEGQLKELRRHKTLWEQLPAELTSQAVELLEGASTTGSTLRIEKNEVQLYLNDATLVLSKSGAQRLEVVLRLLTEVVIAAAQRWGAKLVPQGPGAPAEPGATTGEATAAGMAPPGGPPPVAAPAIAVGAAVLVTWADGNRYPATVSQAAPGQYLCVFANGQQQWVGAPYVNPA